MKTLLYMAASANGCVADHKGATPWSDSEWKNFYKMVRSCGSIVIGRHTYSLMDEAGDFARIGRPYTVVVSKTLALDKGGNIAVARSPRKALALLREAGHSRAMIAGGTKLNSSFIEQNLVDELMLDIEPFLFGAGLPLLQSRPLARDLRLMAVTKYKGGVSLRYKIRGRAAR